MSAPEIIKIDVTCPCCGKVNSLTLGDVDERRNVSCSACQALLGTGQQLREGRFGAPAGEKAQAETAPPKP